MVAKLTTEQFIERSKQKHGNRYDYSSVEYVNNRTKVKITCPIHGSFEQIPDHHLTKGSGCPLCSGVKANQAKAKAEFVSRSREIHNNKYDYSLVNYVNAYTKVILLCREHGDFEQSPASHLSGRGCAKCALSEQGWTRTKFKDKCIKNNNGLGILYVLECFNDNERFIKIGITSLSIKQRYPSKTTMPYAYRVIDEIIGDSEYIYDLEKELHKQHKEHKYIPNILFDGSSTECFKTYITNK